MSVVFPFNIKDIEFFENILMSIGRGNPWHNDVPLLEVDVVYEYILSYYFINCLNWTSISKHIFTCIWYQRSVMASMIN